MTRLLACCLLASAVCAAPQPLSPPISGELLSFETPDEIAKAELEDVQATIVERGEGHALQLVFGTAKGYPTIHLPAPPELWDLSSFAGVQAMVTNPTAAKITVCLRVDNAGDWKKSPWNIEKTDLEPGETKAVQVKFGQSWGNPGFDLNPAAVSAIVIYVNKPAQPLTVLVDDLKAFGSPQVRTEGRVGDDGLLFDFETPPNPKRIEHRGATGTVADGKLTVAFGTDGQWPSLYLYPDGRKWDLSLYESVEMEVTNLSASKVTVLARVDNPNADGQKNCNTERATIEPQKTGTLKVTFGKSWGGVGFALDPSNVVGILLMVDRPKEAYTIAVDNIKANRKQWADVPDWIGSRPPVDGEWVQTFNDNFDGDKLNLDWWTPRYAWDGPIKDQIHRFSMDNVTVKDGEFRILCEKRTGHQYDNPKLETRDYTTGCAITRGKFTQLYGYFEARIKSCTARGLWPAFWMMPDRGEDAGPARNSTADGGMEVDIWEYLCEWGPGRYNVATHWDGYGKDHKSWGTSTLTYLPTRDDWHNYGVLWEPGRLAFYCDGRLMTEWANERVCTVPLYLKLCVQMGGWATKNVDDASLPQELRVDYVRAWQLASRVKPAG